MVIKKAVRYGLKGRIALAGPAGSGKTYTALQFAQVFGKKIGVIDTEHRSASRYADVVPFDVIELDDYSPDNYLDAIQSFADGGYDVLVVDSFSHAWMGENGILDQANKAAKKMKNPNTYTAWKEATPLHQKIVKALLSFPGHVIVTMRSKMDYAIESRDGKTTIRKLGMAPVQRDGVEFEFDIVGDMELPDHSVYFGKCRFSALDGATVQKPGKETASHILAWLNSGVTEGAQAPVQAPAEPVSTGAELLKRIAALEDSIVVGHKASKEQLAKGRVKYGGHADVNRMSATGKTAYFQRLVRLNQEASK